MTSVVVILGKYLLGCQVKNNRRLKGWEKTEVYPLIITQKFKISHFLVYFLHLEWLISFCVTFWQERHGFILFFNTKDKSKAKERYLPHCEHQRLLKVIMKKSILSYLMSYKM